MVIQCLYEDDELFVLNKPSGLVVHRGWATAETALVDFARERTRGGGAYPVQRLDRGASGAVLFAKDSEIARTLQEWAQAGHCSKDYLALVRGEPPLNLDIDHPISRREGGPRVPARTIVRRIYVAPTEPRSVSLVLATPLTGRLHQIRRHLKHANHPLIGDVRYGRGDLNRAFRERYHLQRLALHVCRWSVEPPTRAKRAVAGLVPLPADLAVPLLAMGCKLSADGLPLDLCLEAAWGGPG